MNGAFTLERTISKELRFAARDDVYRVHVALPEGEAPPSGWPVLYLLDATGAFGTCVEAARRMGRRPAATGVSPLVVVGLSAPGSMGGGYDVARRQRDYTTPRRPGAGPPPSGGEAVTTGGAADFLDFIERQVKPFAAGKLAIDPARATLCGHSLAGFFTLWALATRPEAFRTYAAISPSIWWDRPALLDLLRDDTKLLHHRDRRAFIAMGEWEDDLPPWQKSAPDAAGVIARRKARGMVAGAREVAGQLEQVLGPENVRYTLLPEEDHASILSTAMPRVLRLASLG